MTVSAGLATDHIPPSPPLPADVSLSTETDIAPIELARVITQGPEEMCLSLEHQNPSKTSEKMGYFDRVTVSLHIL